MITINKKDIKKLRKFFFESPKDFQSVTSNILTSLAFKTRENDIKNLHRGMIIRNPRFLKSSLRVQKARHGKIDTQVAYAYSMKRARFSGWKESQMGTKREKDRAPTTAARGGMKSKMVKGKYRFKNKSKFYRPEQFQGKSLKQKYMFMMRVLNSRGGGLFEITKNIPTRRGSLNKGLYELKNHRIRLIQKTSGIKRTKRFRWRSMSIRQLKQSDINKIYMKSLKHVLSKYK